MSEGTRAPGASVAVASACVALALALRLPRALLRWDEVSLAYAAYADPAARLVASGDWAGLPRAWVGLHPPLHAALMGLGERVAPIPGVALVFSALCSALACGFIAARFGGLAGLLLATAGVAAHYAGEVNNYPLAALGLAVLLWAAPRRAALRNLGIFLAGWSHVLGLAVAGGLSVVAARWAKGRRAAAAALGGAALVAAPVVVGGLLRAGDGNTFAQPSVPVAEWLGGAAGVMGPVGLAEAVALLAVGLAGLRSGGRALIEAWVALVVIGLTYVAFVMLGVAAPHQFPYLSLVVVPLCALATAARSPLVRGGLGALSAASGLLFVVPELGRVAAVRADLGRPRAVDVALAEARCQDLLWLVSPALQADDDKTDRSPVLWRLSPFQLAPRSGGPLADLTDWRLGHPRWVAGVELRTSTELGWAPLDAAVAAAAGRGAGAFIVLYDHAPAAGLDARLTRALRAWPHERRPIGEDDGLGVDLLFTVPAPEGAVARPAAHQGCADG